MQFYPTFDYFMVMCNMFHVLKGRLRNVLPGRIYSRLLVSPFLPGTT